MTLTATPLRKAAKFIRGITFKPEDMCSPSEPGAVVCMRTKNVQADIDLSDLIAIPEAFVRRAEQNLVEGDLLVSSANSWNLVGKACWVPNLSYRSTAGGFISILRCDRDLVFPRYFYHWVTSGQTQHDLRNCGRQTTNISNLDFGRALDLEIPLPALAEQKRIAAILDKADAIRRKLQQSLRLSDDFLRSVFLDMFGSDKSPKCDRVPLGPFLEFMTSGGRGWSQYYAPSGARFIRSLDVQMNEIGEKDVAYVAAPNNAEAKRTRVQENDVLLTITGSLIGRVARIPKEHAGAYISQHVAILRLGKGLDPEFLARFLSMDEGQRLVQKSQYGQTKPGLNFDQIRRFTVPLPSATLQKRFVEIANRVNASSMKSRTFMSQSETLFSSLQQRAFRGEL